MASIASLPGEKVLSPDVAPALQQDGLHRRLVESVSDYAIYMLDAGGIVSSWNLGAQRFKGYTADEIIGRHFSLFYTGSDRAAGKPERALATAAREGRFEDKAWRVRKDGAIFRAHVVIDPIRDDDGTIIGYAKITRDISEVYEREQALRESEQRFRHLVSSITDYAIYMLDLSGNISSWNAGAERFKRYSEHEVLGRHFSLFYSPEDVASGKPARALQLAATEGRFEDHGWRIRKGGEAFWAHVIIDPIFDDDGRPIGFAKITRDVSEQRAAHLRLLDLTRINEELEQFVHVASHDMREPLRKILAFSDCLEVDEGDRLSDDARLYLHSISAAARRMEELLESLLRLTRVTSHGQTFERCDLNAVLADVRSDLEIPLAEQQAVLAVGDLPLIDADATQMRQLFQNIVQNALKYARDGRAPRIVIECVAPDAEGRIGIAVRDNGIGFDMAYCERIFGVFQRLHTRDQYPGAGIGLAVCRKICERHGGTITARGTPGEGAVISVFLPVGAGR